MAAVMGRNARPEHRFAAAQPTPTACGHCPTNVSRGRRLPIQHKLQAAPTSQHPTGASAASSFTQHVGSCCKPAHLQAGHNLFPPHTHPTPQT